MGNDALGAIMNHLLYQITGLHWETGYFHHSKLDFGTRTGDLVFEISSESIIRVLFTPEVRNRGWKGEVTVRDLNFDRWVRGSLVYLSSDMNVIARVSFPMTFIDNSPYIDGDHFLRVWQDLLADLARR
jgi:hypothetical protein